MATVCSSAINSGSLASNATKTGFFDPILNQHINVFLSKTNNASPPNKTDVMAVKNNRFGRMGPAVPKIPFKVRMALYPNNPTVEVVDSNNVVSYINKRRVNVEDRLDVLRKICNIPYCKFNRLPKAVVRVLGYDFYNINKAIDTVLYGKVGHKNNTPLVPDDKISGCTKYNLGYELRFFQPQSRIDIFFKFGGYIVDSYDFKVSMQALYLHGRTIHDFKVMAHVCQSKTVTSPFCSSFNLKDKLNFRQFSTKVLISSVIGLFDEYVYYTNLYFGKAFREFYSVASKSIQENQKKYCEYVSRLSTKGAKIGTDSNKGKTSENRTSFKDVVNKPELTFGSLKGVKLVHNSVATPSRPTPSIPLVTFVVDDKGHESFIIKEKNGFTKKITNDERALVTLFNATLTDRKYNLHPKCKVGKHGRLEDFPNDFCWIDAFACAGKKMPVDLQPYPQISIAYLFRCGLSRVIQKHSRETGWRLFHFDRRQVVNLKRLPHGAVLGVKGDMNIPNITRNIDILFDDLVGNVIEQTSLKADNLLLSNVVNRLSDRVNRMCERPKQLTIKTTLDSNQKRKLTKLFPEVTMNFEDSTYSSHPLQTAMRTCENFVMDRKCGGREYIDVGGDVVSLLCKESKDVHLCCPVVDVKDAHRHITRSNIIDRMKGFDESITICDKLTQDCDVSYPNIVAVEVYDMSLEDMARSILSHKAKRFDLSLIIPPEICDSYCDVLLFDDSMRVFVREGVVNYEYGSSGECYRHDLKTLQDILRVQLFVVDGVVFKKTLECSREQLHFYSIVPCVNMKPGVYNLTSHYSKSRNDKVEMIIPVREFDGGLRNVRVSVDKYVTMHLIEYAMNTTLKVEDKAAEYLISQFRSRKSVSISGGKVVQKEFDLPDELHAGYLAVIMAEGARRREKVVNLARVSYFKHYAPTVIQVLFNIFYELYGFAKRMCYKAFISAMSLVMSEDFLEKVVVGERRIFEVQEVVHFDQEIVLVGKQGSMNVLQESLNNFTVENEKRAVDISQIVYANRDSFADDELDTMKELFQTGGGSKFRRFTSNLERCTYGFYSKVWNFASFYVKDVKMVRLVTNFFVSLCDFFRQCGISTWEYIRSVFKEFVGFVRGGLKGSFPNMWSEMKKAAKFMKEKFNAQSEDLKSLLQDFYTRQTGLDNDGNELFWQDLTYDLGTRRLFSEEKKNRLVAGMKRTYKNFLGMTSKLLSKIMMVYKYMKFIFTYVRDQFKGEDLINTIDHIIKGVSFFFVHALSLCAMGSFSFTGLVAAVSTYLGLKFTGIEKKYLGSSIVSQHLITACSVSSPAALMTLPVRSAITKCVEIGLKKKLSKCEGLTSTMQTVIAKDAIGMKWYSHVTPYRIRMTIYTSLVLVFFFPRLAIALMLTTILVAEHKKYFDKFAIVANVNLSFASVLNRTQPTKRMTTLKRLLKEKFLTAKIKEQNEDGASTVDGEPSQDAMLGGDIELRDDEIDVEFDYDGSYVERHGKLSASKLVVEEDLKPSAADGLNFYQLKISGKGNFMQFNVPFKVSAAMTQYAFRDIPSIVYVGDEKLDTLNEYYYLEKKKTFMELGKLDNVVDMYLSQLDNKSSFDKVVFHLRQRFDDSTLYVSEDGVRWHKLKIGSKSIVSLDHKCKYDCNRVLMAYDSECKNFQVTSDELAGMYSNERCLALEYLTVDKIPQLARDLTHKVKFFNKPPGAGKTTTIVNEFSRLHNEGKRCLALTCTKAGKIEIAEKLKARGIKSVFSNCLTYDAFLMKNMYRDVDYVFCDEIFMIHAGLWLAITCNLEFSSMSCYGDVNQIPYINRVPNTICTKSMNHFYAYEMFHDNISYRCPVDVCKLLSTLTDNTGKLIYPKGVYPVGDNANVLRSLQIVPIYSPEDAMDDQNVKIVTFTQPEKEEMIKATRMRNGVSSSVNTVNEVQGGTFSKVDVYRLKPYDNPIYSDLNQFVVSISRHTQLMRYRVVSSKMSDKIANNISSMDNVSDFILKEFAAKRCV
uniref:Polyprotein 1a n=1 Tax=Sweet potato chlorotic stunt virus TaxID=81931 RepID=A0A2H4D707_9CLOS|nr:polyprotein 1a [Sweet potato chlorotic stunt virus]